jgi:hypothetical protein
MKKGVRVRLFEAQGNRHVWQLIFKTYTSWRSNYNIGYRVKTSSGNW